MNYCIFEGIRECPPILGNLRFICIRKKWNPNKPFGKSTLKRPYFWIQPQEQQTFIRLNLNASLDSWTYANPRTNFVIINAIASYTISSNFQKTHTFLRLIDNSQPPTKRSPLCKLPRFFQTKRSASWTRLFLSKTLVSNCWRTDLSTWKFPPNLRPRLGSRGTWRSEQNIVWIYPTNRGWRLKWRYIPGTLQLTASLPLKMDGWKMSFLLGGCLFSGANC